MASTISELSIIGRLGKDPELKFTASGRELCNLSVAVSHWSRPREEGGEPVEETNWFNATAWGNLATMVSDRFAKGDKVFISGLFKARQYKRDDGVNGTALEINIQNIVNLSPRQRDDDGLSANEAPLPVSEGSRPVVNTGGPAKKRW